MTMKRHSRRTFVGGLAAGAVVLGFSPLRRQWITDVHAEGVVDVETLPPLDGVLALDDASRDAAAIDFGRFVQERPVAVLKPGIGSRPGSRPAVRAPARSPRRGPRTRPFPVTGRRSSTTASSSTCPH